MDAHAVSLLALFEKKMRLEVPLFQRQYVWNEEHQWQPLWEDISRKFVDYLAGRKDAPQHFLGAMVLDQKQTPSTHVEKRQVIDGQQRLTTLQIFLAAFRDFCRAEGCEDLATECEMFTENKGMMADPKVDRFKVWPTQLDRAQFSDVVASGSRVELEKKYPLVWKKYARKPEPRPRMVAAYIFFYDQISDFFKGTDFETPLSAEIPLAKRLEESFQALRNALKVVAIDLQQDDDAQVIFETLNARGEPLLPADLLRNYIFLRAARNGESQEELYEQFWRPFDEEFWRQEVRQGRLNRPRSDLFLQHLLASRQGVEIPIKHLFVEYKHWIEKFRPFPKVRDELATIARQGADFRRLIAPAEGDVLHGLSTFLEAFDVGTAYPMLLALLDARPSDAEIIDVANILESYLVRRNICGLTNKNYNRIFLQMTRSLREDGATAAVVGAYLASLDGESSLWPGDERFEGGWKTSNAYQVLSNSKLIHIFRRLNETCVSTKVERLTFDAPLTIEHILPQTWLEHWMLPNNAKGMSEVDLWGAKADDEIAIASRRRNALLQTLGNLTIITGNLNSSVSNSAWVTKKPALLSASLLPINQQLHEYETWDEEAIDRRSGELFKRALGIWSGPRRYRVAS